MGKSKAYVREKLSDEKTDAFIVNANTPMDPNDDKNKSGSIYGKTVNRTTFYLVRLVLSQPSIYITY